MRARRDGHRACAAEGQTVSPTSMGSEARSRRAANKKARGAYQALVTAATSAIKDADPIGLLEIGAPSDEYSPEIDAIVPRSAGAGGPSDAARILHEEFVRWCLTKRQRGPRTRTWRAPSASGRPSLSSEMRANTPLQPTSGAIASASCGGMRGAARG